MSEPLELGRFESRKSGPSHLHPLPSNGSRLSHSSSIALIEFNRLKFSSLGLYGRESELQKLQEIFQNIGNKEPQEVPLSNLVMVGGRSGTGKSTLVMDFGRRIRNMDKNTLFVSGRCEQHKFSPYVAFRSAFTQLCSDLLSHNLYESHIRSLVRSALGSDYKLLQDMIPNVGELIYEVGSQPADSTTSPQEYDVLKSSAKFKFLMIRFLRAVSQPEHK